MVPLDVDRSIHIRSGVSSGALGTAVLSGGDIIGGEKEGMMKPAGVIEDTVGVVMTTEPLNGGPVSSELLPPASIINVGATTDVEVNGIGVITIGTDTRVDVVARVGRNGSSGSKGLVGAVVMVV